MVHQSIDRRRAGYSLLEDFIPFAENEIAGDHLAFAFISFRKKSEEQFHFFPALLDIADIINQHDFESIELHPIAVSPMHYFLIRSADTSEP